MRKSITVLFIWTVCVSVLSGQDSVPAAADENDQHAGTIYGVSVGMTVSEALEGVYYSARRKPGEEKPDAMRKEEKGDIRVLYKTLPLGELQIVFDQGKIVREIVLTYVQRPSIEDLRLPASSDIGVASSGARYDDRYSIGFVDTKKQEKLWWRDLQIGRGYQTRISFRSGNVLKDGQLWWQVITQKAVMVKPDDVKKFRKAIEELKS